MSFARTDGRAPNGLRPVKITPGFLAYAEGSVLIEMGNTRVICAASLEERVPPFLRNTGQGWITAEYAMLPRSTDSYCARNRRGGASGRTHEIQRLIGRSQELLLHRKKLGRAHRRSDCDVPAGGWRNSHSSNHRRLCGICDRGTSPVKERKDFKVDRIKSSCGS
jgi:ribonuclease PH